MSVVTIDPSGWLGFGTSLRQSSVIGSDYLGNKFHDMFRYMSDPYRKKTDKKKIKKKTKGIKTKEKRKGKSSTTSESVAFQPPLVEIFSNPSSFATFTGVRQSVLEKQIRDAAQLYIAANINHFSDSETEEEEEDKNNELPIRVPKIVGIGLCSVFEIIRESHHSHPSICMRSLQALLDMLQGQQPEGLKSEPSEVIDALFDQLLYLTTSHSLDNQSKESHTRLTSLACACLLSLVIARGDTGKLLSATAAILMSPRKLAMEEIEMPGVLNSLQQSVHAVLLGKTVRPDWLTHGIVKKSLIDSFPVRINDDGVNVTVSSIASDGCYLYIHSETGLYKISSGYGETIRGTVIVHRPDFHSKEKGWLGYAQGRLFFKSLSSLSGEIIVLDRDLLKEKELVFFEGKEWGPNIMFSDGQHLGHIASTKDDSFVVRLFNPNITPMPCIGELPLKLARKCLDVFGYASFDEETNMHTINIGTDEEPGHIAAGKEFVLIRTNAGKIMYSGKSQCLGIKQGNATLGKWNELPLTKSPKVVQHSIGHEGLHALLVSEDGSVYFVGTARRGEDGDQSKGRRPPKPVKPKKMIKMDGLNVVYSACNNGSSAIITRDGELYIFGKDTAHCDHTTGQVTDLKDVHITQVALGKAHVVALTNNGQLYTFGINNKGQCGRDFSCSHSREALSVTMATTNEEECEDEELEQDETDVMCMPGKHKWKHDQCMVCTVCGECTGYGSGCISNGRPDRNPGLPCGCGSGDSGCAECGCCRTCAHENIEQDSESSAFGGNGVSGILDMKVRDMIRLDLIIGGRQGARLQDQLQRRFDERRHRHKTKHTVRPKIKGTKTIKTEHLPDKGPLIPLEDAMNSDQERDTSKISSLPPGHVSLPFDSAVTQVSCGLHHTVLLTETGDVYTFGSNQYGQLGLGDHSHRGTPTLVKLSQSATHVAAGSNHTVVLVNTGQVYTFGNHQKAQLGRCFSNNMIDEVKVKEKNAKESSWYTVPGLVPNVGPKHGRRATWVGASGDQTFIKIDESLINAHSLSRSSIVANNTCIGLIPSTSEHTSFKCLIINKSDGNCRSFSDVDHVDFTGQSACLDPIYNVLWSHNPQVNQVNCYNVIASEAQRLHSDSTSMPDLLSPELALPTHSHCRISCSHAALHLLGCLDTLTICQERNMRVQEDDQDRQNVARIYSKEDFIPVNRFESHGGGWGYSGHSIEAIRFMADTDILLGGFGLFGGRGEYTGKIKLFDIGMDGGDQETDGELLAETEEVLYECGARQKYPMLFDEPIPLQANRWYVAWARVSGPSSDCGSSGQSVVTTEDQVIFYFKSSKKSNNGTDVNAGQIPQLLYRVITPDNQATSRQSDRIENVYILRQEFSRTVTPDCFQPLLQLLQWSWQTFKVSVVETHQMHDLNGIYTAVIMDLERLVYISTASLRLIRTYINEVYPNLVSHKAPVETLKLAECVAEVRALLRRILSDNVSHLYVSPRVTSVLKLTRGNSKPETTFYSRMFSTILDECHQTFVACFHAFYPSRYLKWSCLCDLLTSMDNLCSASSSKMTNEIEGCDRLLAAVLAALSCPTVKLTAILPITYEFDNDAFGKQSSSVGNSANNIENNVHGEPQRYPLLVEHMNYRCQVDGMAKPASSFCKVLDQLLAIITKPVQQLLSQERLTYSSRLVANACNLLAAVVAELASQTTGTDAEFQNASGRILQLTPSRFTRTNQSRTWNTGNGSPDAICFSVDRPGIVIAGVCVYGGVGFYDYELELLDDQSGNGGDGSHTQRWTSLEIVRGTFGPDDCTGDIAEIKFDRPISVRENIKYALRLRNHGGRTSNGDGGLASVKAPDGTTFRFTACSLSFNGTNHTRGQIPQILYYSSTPQDSESQQSTRALAELQARKGALSMTSSIVKMCIDLLTKAQGITDKLILEAVGSAHIISLLLPLILAQIGPVAASDPRSAVQVMSLIQDLLPPVASINNQLALHLPILPGEQVMQDTNLCTTSYHYAVVESDHPYKPVTVAHYRVVFPENVKWMSLEFDPQCGTAQAEDSLQLYIPSREMLPETAILKLRDDNEVLSTPYWPILRKFSGTQSWPHNAIVLPGNEVIFSLETASDYVKDDKACFYGFKCLIVGYEWTKVEEEGLKYLEKELAYLGGTCAASLMKKDLLLPPASVDEMEDDLEMLEEIAQQVYTSHSALLSKGFALSHCPTIHQALEGMLPFNCHFNERSFLKDFVTCAPGTSGGRLARWLQPDSYVDPKLCELIYAKDEIKCGWPTIISVVTKDQYGNPVHVPNLRVEVKAMPIDKKDRSSEDSNCKIPRISKPDSMTFGGHPYPNLETQYEVTVKDKMCYNAISMMKAYENYSFEELRYMTPAVKRPSENMMVRANNNSTYSASWTPSSVGWYSIHATVDGSEIDEVYKAEVKETPVGLTPPSQNMAKKNTFQQNKIRKFVSSCSAGLRIRAHPSLQSEQIGIVHVNGTVCFLEELRNDGGVWLHLSPNTVKKYCMNGQVDGWCLQYNQHLGKTLLVPVEEPKSLLDQIAKETVIRKLPESGTKENRTKQRRSGPGVYHVVKCGASGHNIRSRPSLKAPPVGMLVLTNEINVSEDIINPEGVWVKLDKESMRRYCFNTEGEAWSLSLTRDDTMYLQHENDVSFLEHQDDDKPDIDSDPPEFGNSNTEPKKVNGFDFSSAAQKSNFSSFNGQTRGAFSFGTMDKQDGTLSDSSSPFVFGSLSNPPFQMLMSSKSANEPFTMIDQDCTEREQSSRLSVLQRWLKEEESRHERTDSSPRDIPPELLGVSVKELVKAIGESRANGNGVTPPRTPPGTPRRMSRSSSPLATSTPLTTSHLGSRESSPVLGGKGLTSMHDHSTSAPVMGTSKLSGAFPLASNQEMKILNPIQRKSSLQIDSTGQIYSEATESVENILENFQKDGENNSAANKEVIQTGTQTSPEGLTGHFSIGSGNNKDEPHLSPKHGRKERSPRTLRSKRERAMSPAPSSKDKPPQREGSKEPVKVALSPSVAECLRAVFASLLWHEGITHDAMACASFLKFHPNLPKQEAQVKKREYTGKTDTLTKEQKARQRHSVEVSTYSYLNIQPNSTEGLTKCYMNANVNKNKMRKTSESIKEEGTILDRSPSTDETNVSNKPQSNVGTPSFSSGSMQSGGLPPSLQHLVTLWEEMVNACLRAIAQQIILPSPTIPVQTLKNEKKEREREKDKRNKKKKDWKPIGVGRGNLFGEAAGLPFTGAERETVCELCGFYSPHPVTYHMKQAHPGCGGHAGGKGYNSSGNFCGGWAGNCGDGGVGGSSWYLICDRCREKYLKQKRQLLMKEKSKKSKKKFSPNKVMSPLSQMDVHHIMKNNAMFLLDLASASSTSLPSHSVASHKKSPYRNSMPSLNEHSPLDASPFPPIPFQCLRTLGMQPSELNLLSEDFLLEESLRQNNDAAAIGRTTSDIGSRLSAADLEDQLGMSGNGEVTSTSDSEINRGRVGFHRSISVGTTGREWNKHEGESRVIMTRKRNNSSGESSDTGSSLLCHPSSNLTKLVTLIMDKNHAGEILNRPIMAFILQRHDLESLQLTMRQALRKGACRVFALQALNWLIRSVTQPTAIHDLLWCFVAALSPVPVETPDEDDDGEKKEKKDSEQIPEKEKDNICEHPLSDISIAGEAVHPLLTTFHSLLQTISDLMMLLPMGSALQQMAMRCWCLKFHQSDHLFLHRSHVFSNISKILSRSEEEGTDEASSTMGDSFQVTSVVECLKDVTSDCEMKASSRQAMIGSLMDNSTETFWESGDEDRNKTKIITVCSNPRAIPKIVYVHIDNCRDLGNKVSSVTFKIGPNADDQVKLKYSEIESRYTGWVCCPIVANKHHVLRLEFKGPDNTLRLRQIKILGEIEGESLTSGKLHSAMVIQQKNCEAETLKVFRMLTSQVFGKLISGDSDDARQEQREEVSEENQKDDITKAEGNNDLKEHMVGILFSRSKLTHLQKQVCAHIVQAIRKEAVRVREEWEALLCSKSLSMDELPKSSDAYCFEMLSMVLALSGSSVGRAYLAQQHTLLRDLLSLLHTGSARVQRQVTSLLKRVLPDVSPQTFANILSVPALPPKDFSIITEAGKSPQEQDQPLDIHKMGILDVFLSCIAKALTVQMKIKGKESGKGITTITLATAIHPRDNVGARWWLRGCLTRKLAEVIIQLLIDMAAGKLSEAWANVTKGAIAENVLNLTKLDEKYRIPSECLKTPTLWLALASLCVLEQEHVERLSSGQWMGSGEGQQAQPRPLCENHDDGETLAIILCSVCGNLCADCDRFLHLHRRTRSHQRQVFKEEEEAIKVDLHEGCGRTKLFWIMALADSKTLKAMIEFREGNRGKPTSSSLGTCRFCGTTGNTGLLAIGNVCGDAECQEHARNACTKTLPCGHVCGGIVNENPCLPCLHGCSGDLSLKQDADDMCMICFTEALACAPAAQLKCGHVFHLHCCCNVLKRRWSGPRITFGFSLCPICKTSMEHPVLKELLVPIRNLYEDVHRKALMRLEYEGLHKAEAITTPGARFFNDTAGYAMERYAYYVCYKCKKAYYGGEARCDAEAGGGDDYDPTELVCGACSDISRAQMCPKHGTDFLEYKCRYCCSVAVFFCFGTTHFCNACHDDFQRVTNIPKLELPHCPTGPKAKQLEGDECPLHIQHPPTGEEFALGCGVCRNAHTF